jgi:outer membrane receptor protein involved in Fe transport
MKKFLTLLALITALFSQAQTKSHIAGRVVDGSQKTVESATISLVRSSDSSAVKLAVADKTGLFSFDNIAPGSYRVAVSAVGHLTAFSETFAVDEAHHDITIKTIQLQQSDKLLGGVVITAKKPLVEHKIDRTVVNVDASITNVGSTALEVLEKSPGVTVDKDGNISLKGKEGIMVLVDGRPTQLSGADLANMLRSMNSAQLDQIEIMTNPPAKYDAAGNAGIINIKTKKNKQAGYNGSVNLGFGQARFSKFNESVNMNYRQGKVNLFTNLSHNYRRSYNNLYLQRFVRDRTTKDLQSYFDQQNYMAMEFNSYGGKLGMDYAATKKTTFGFVVDAYTEPGNFGNRNLTLISDPHMVLQSKTVATADYDQSWKNLSLNLNFRTQLDTAGRELTGDFDRLIYNSRNNQTLVNAYYDANDRPLEATDTLLGALPQDITIYSGRIDYVQPLKKGARFEAGLKSSFVKTDNDAHYDSIQMGNIVHDYNRSNYFVYQENVNAAYANLSGPLGKKWNGQLGLRVENTISKGRQITTGQEFDRNYTQLFPTAYLQYKLNDKNNFGLNYGRRIRRPDYEDLNPFIRFLDRYTYQQGNPNLKPQFSHNIELSHTYNNFLTTTLNYNSTNDIIQGIVEQKGQEAFARPSNIASLHQYGLEVNANHSVNKWWTASGYAYVYNNRFSGIVDSAKVSVSATMLSLQSTQQFKIGKTLTAEVSGYFRSGGLQGVIVTRPRGELSAGLSQQVLKGKGTLRLNISDILKTQSGYGRSQYGNTDMTFEETRESRVVNIGFSYRFGKGKAGSERRRNGSAGEEQNRVGH